MDSISPEQRHYNMSQIHSKDTRPEIIVRKSLFARGLRYRKNDKKLPGHPDIVFPRYHTVVFVNGCFWHGHEGCNFFVMPKSNREFWKAKIERNRERDAEVNSKLTGMGWNVLTIWECQLRKDRIEDTIELTYKKITSGE